MLAPDVTQTDPGLQRPRDDRARDVARLLFIDEEFIPFLRERPIRKTQSAKRFGHLAVGPDARDYLLAYITSLGIADGPRFDTCLGSEIGFVHVDAETREACFDSNHFRCVPTADASSQFLD